LLLTPAPVQALKTELDPISDLGPHLYAIFTGVRLDLEEDPHADRLRETLVRFNTPMSSASYKIGACLIRGIIFYDHKEATGNTPMPITQKSVRRLLEPDFQARVIQFARQAMLDAAAAAKTIREEGLPQLPQVRKDLEDYVSDYVTRDALKREREKSRVPSFLWNAIEGKIDETPWEIGEVQQFPQRFAIASDLIRRLPSFLDNLELHFRRLTEISSQEMVEHGYTTFDDLVRLYRDRVLCSFIFSEMQFNWFSAHRAFGIGSVMVGPGLNRNRNRKRKCLL
jgi:hypothetical protein